MLCHILHIRKYLSLQPRFQIIFWCRDRDWEAEPCDRQFWAPENNHPWGWLGCIWLQRLFPSLSWSSGVRAGREKRKQGTVKGISKVAVETSFSNTRVRYVQSTRLAFYNPCMARRVDIFMGVPKVGEKETIVDKWFEGRLYEFSRLVDEAVKRYHRTRTEFIPVWNIMRAHWTALKS